MRGEINYLGVTTAFISSEFEFYRDVKSNGRPRTEILFNGYNFTIPANPEGLRFLEELLRSNKQFHDIDQPNPTLREVLSPFTVKVYDEQGYIVRTIELIDTHIQNYREIFDILQNIEGTASMNIHIKVMSAIQRINKKAINVFRWHISDYGIKEYKTPVNEIESDKNPEIIKGFWTSDQEGNEPLKKSKLGETVYFQIETKNIKNGEKLNLRLGEYDYNFWFDNLDPDDYEFPVEEVKKIATVKNNKATVKLRLEESWEKVIKDDHSTWFQLDQSVELYWEVRYKNQKKELPADTDSYLKVEQSDRTLYFKTPTPNHNLPEFISYDGDPMLLVEFQKEFPKDKIKDNVLDVASKKAASQINKIAFSKLKKGYLVDDKGKVYTGERLVYEYKKIYSNSGELFENVQKGKNFGYKHSNSLTTTKGISQYDYFAKNGKRVKLLGVVKSIGSALDIFSVLKFGMDDLDTSESAPIPLGPFSPISDLAGVLVQKQKADMEMWLKEHVQLEIDQVKLQGLEATRKVVNSWNHNKEFKWFLMEVSAETANKLIAGEFKTFSELYDFNSDGSYRESNIEILYREVKNNNREEFVYVIETIFINE